MGKRTNKDSAKLADHKNISYITTRRKIPRQSSPYKWHCYASATRSYVHQYAAEAL